MERGEHTRTVAAVGGALAALAVFIVFARSGVVAAPATSAPPTLTAVGTVSGPPKTDVAYLYTWTRQCPDDSTAIVLVWDNPSTPIGRSPAPSNGRCTATVVGNVPAGAALGIHHPTAYVQTPSGAAENAVGDAFRVTLPPTPTPTRTPAPAHASKQGVAPSPASILQPAAASYTPLPAGSFSPSGPPPLGSSPTPAATIVPIISSGGRGSAIGNIALALFVVMLVAGGVLTNSVRLRRRRQSLRNQDPLELMR